MLAFSGMGIALGKLRRKTGTDGAQKTLMGTKQMWPRKESSSHHGKDKRKLAGDMAGEPVRFGAESTRDTVKEGIREKRHRHDQDPSEGSDVDAFTDEGYEWDP